MAMGLHPCLKMVPFGLLLSLLMVTGADVFFPAAGNQGDFRPSPLLFLRHDSQRSNRTTLPDVSSFHPNPLPAISAESVPQTGSFGVAQVRFVESDGRYQNPSAGSVDQDPSNQPISTGPRRQKSIETSGRSISPSVPVVTDVVDHIVRGEDRWPWPSRPDHQNVGRQLSRPFEPITTTFTPLDETEQVEGSLIVQKAVPKPYRILTHVSSCPKLFHDLSISCQLPRQQKQEQPVSFQWRKTIYNQNIDAVLKSRLVLDPPIKLTIAYGNQLQTKDPRYGVQADNDSTILTIRQLKVSDCGSYTCEAAFLNGTIIASSDLMIFLCF